MGTFTGARRYVLQTFANTESALMKKRVARYHAERATARSATASGCGRSRCRSRSPASTSPSCRGCR